MQQAQGNAERAKYARAHGMDLLYAEVRHNGYATWSYSDGVRVPVRLFATLEGLQGYATRRRFAIIYVD